MLFGDRINGNDGFCTVTVTVNDPTEACEPSKVFLTETGQFYDSIEEAIAASTQPGTIFISPEAFDENPDFSGKELRVVIGLPPVTVD